MDKAIIVIDMPDNCMKCDFSNAFGECNYVGNVGEAFEQGLRYIKCPLKPMPNYKLNTIPNGAYARGWDDCIDEILGEENESNIST